MTIILCYMKVLVCTVTSRCYIWFVLLNILLLQGVDLEDANKQADKKKSRTRANKKPKVRVQYTSLGGSIVSFVVSFSKAYVCTVSMTVFSFHTYHGQLW